MAQNHSTTRRKNYKFVFVFSKLFSPVFNILFYIAVFFIVLSMILCIIIFFVNVEAEKMLLPPFMHKIADDTGNITSYEISFGNGIKIITDVANVELGDIKSVLYAGLFVLICTFLTIAPIFKFLSMLLKNITSGNLNDIIDEQNPRYVMFIGLCVFLGTILIRFMMRFYNYYLAVRFIKGAPQEIKLSLGIDFLDGITGLVILFVGLIFAYVFQRIKEDR